MSSPLDMRTMNNGGVVEAVNIALAKVADNIADVNTPPDKPRTVTLKITFKPDESRTLIASKAVVTTNLQPQEPQTIPVVLDKLDGAPSPGWAFHTPNRGPRIRITRDDMTKWEWAFYVTVIVFFVWVTWLAR